MRASLRLALTLLAVGTATVLLLPLHWLALKAGWRSRQLPRLWNRIVLAALGWRVRIRGELSPGPVLVAANHVSWADTVALTAHADVKFVAKSEVRDWPLFGLLSRLQDTVYVERADRRGAGRQARSLAERLKRGEALVLFPEGTTADGNHLLPFKTSLFEALELAAREGGGEVPAVQPVAIAYTRLYGVPLGRAEREVAAWTGELTLAAHLVILARKGPLDLTISFGEPIAFAFGDGRKSAAAKAQAAARRLVVEALRG